MNMSQSRLTKPSPKIPERLKARQSSKQKPRAPPQRNPAFGGGAAMSGAMQEDGPMVGRPARGPRGMPPGSFEVPESAPMDSDLR